MSYEIPTRYKSRYEENLELQLADAGQEIDTLKKALAIYANKDNWTATARSSVLTGEVRADGWEEHVEVELIMDYAWVFEYTDDHGWEIAHNAIQAVST